jgi:hypothetical protein
MSNIDKFQGGDDVENSTEEQSEQVAYHYSSHIAGHHQCSADSDGSGFQPIVQGKSNGCLPRSILAGGQ